MRLILCRGVWAEVRRDMRTAIVAPKVVVRTVLAGIAVAGLVAGCSPTKDGNPQGVVSGTPTSGEQTVQFNPCTDLSDEALRAIHVDPATKYTVTDAARGGVSARICKWDSTQGPYFVTVSSTTSTQDDARKNDSLTGLRDVKIGPRSGLTYKDKSDEGNLRCYASLPAAQGMFEVTVGWRYGDPVTRDVCELAVEHAKQLEPYLPK
ncbi:DUF3558 domain-containing protein [Nocardia sp. NPDC050175]|uniref:DUF3558 domain-containing protein n=1 Tax=Nocardia sp. NPDC050175 TaxID=3364317 RepID=UPI003790C018